MTPKIAPLRALPLAVATSIALTSMPALAAEPTAPEPTVAQAPSPEATDAATPPAVDPAEQAELDRVLGHARRLKITGGVFALIGVGALVSGTIVGAQENYGLAIGLSAKAAVASSIGAILIVAGNRRQKNPRRFMRTKNLAFSVSPRLSSEFRGATLSLRF